MSNNRGKIILGALAVSDSIWIYAIMAVAGLTIGLGGSPISWAALLAFYAFAMFVSWVFMGLRGSAAALAIMEGLVGLVAVYLTVAAGSFHADRSFDMAWAVKLAGADLDATAVVGAVFSLIALLLLWRRAVTVVADDFAGERLKSGFKRGIVIIAIAALAEQLASREVGIQLLLAPFFAASLAGLAVSRLPERGLGGKGVSWVRVIGAAVLALIAIGLGLGLLGGVYGINVLRLMFKGWGLFVDGMLWVLRYPLEVVVNLIMLILNWLRSMFGSEEPIEREMGGGLPQSITEAADPAGENQLFETIFNIIQYPLLAIVLVGAFLVLALAYRRFTSGRRKEADEERESIQEDPDAAGDLLKLLAGLLPSWMKREREEERPWRYPEDEPGVAEVFILYFDYLSAAIANGMTFIPGVTPSERAPAMQAALPGAQVALVTEMFNAACYGHVAAPRSTVDRLRNELLAIGQSEDDVRQPS